jgi:GNAT superfamily N-acetyltransferase
MQLTIRAATLADARLLGEMNRQLADAEQSRNALSVGALARRMEEWLSADWRGVLFEIPEVVGYCIFQIGSDYYEPTIPEVYVRQFFIAADQRGLGLGRRAFELLRTTEFPPESRIHLDVLATNPPGQRFWQSVGFEPYSVAMRFVPRDD